MHPILTILLWKKMINLMMIILIQLWHSMIALVWGNTILRMYHVISNPLGILVGPKIPLS